MVVWVWGFGFGVGVLNWAFQVGVFSWWGLGPVVWGLLVFLGWGSLFKHKRITLGKKWCHIDLWLGQCIVMLIYIDLISCTEVNLIVCTSSKSRCIFLSNPHMKHHKLIQIEKKFTPLKANPLHIVYYTCGVVPFLQRENLKIINDTTNQGVLLLVQTMSNRLSSKAFQLCWIFESSDFPEKDS